MSGTLFQWIFGSLSAVGMGFTLGLVGGGGAILSIPIFIYVYGIPPLEATQYSLFVVGATAAFGTVRNHRQKLIDWRKFSSFVLPSFVGVFIVRGVLMPRFPKSVPLPWGGEILFDHLLLGVFVVVMFVAARSMLRKAPPPDSRPVQPSRAHAALQGLGVGAFTGLIGASGGFLIVPALVNFLAVPIRIAIGTSLVVVAANTLFGFAVGLAHHPDLRWGLLLKFTGFALVGMLLGTWANGRIAPEKLKRSFGYFIIVMGIAMIALQLMHAGR